MWNNLDQLLSAESMNGYGLKTGFKELDLILKGLLPGNLITIGGETSSGKTAFMLQILQHLALEEKIPIMLFSSEMTDHEIVCRLLSQRTQIDVFKFINGSMSESEWLTLNEKINELKISSFNIESSHQLYIEDVCEVARKAKEKLGIKLIAIDYLQLMYYHAKMNDNRYTEINAIISQLKSLAMELELPIIVLSQLNNKIDLREGFADKKPQSTDLRDSGTIYSDSDVVLFLYRPELYKLYTDYNGNDWRGKVSVHIAKQRNGPIGDVKLCFNANCCLFSDHAEKEYSNLIYSLPN